MGAVAAMLKDQGHIVSGSDTGVYPPMSLFLEKKGIPAGNGFSADHLPEDKETLIVVGNAVKRGNPELEVALEQKRLCLSLPEVLKYFFLTKSHNLVVTGTHGKTTTTSLLAWLFQHAGKEPSYLIGGLPRNFTEGCRKQAGAHWIIEGDEYDTAYFDKRSKFLHYLPELVIINNIEFDHADIYDDLAAIQLSFKRLVRIIPRNGIILVNADDVNARAVIEESPAPILEVGFSPNAGAKIDDVSYFPDRSEFTLFKHRFSVPLVGEFNVRNAAMAVAAAHFYQIPLETIAAGLALFQGIRRRQEVRGEKKGITVIDDFGHHPTAIGETLRGLRHRYAGRRLWAVFEPRSNTTRRAVFQESLPAALGEADGVFVAQVAALEQIPADQRLNPEKVVADLNARGIPAHYSQNADTIVATLVPLLKETDVVVIFSNGGFGGIHEKLLGAI